MLAALVVLGVMAFTGLLTYHVTVKPLGGVFEKIIPDSTVAGGQQPDAEFAKMLDSAELPDIDPGEKVFQKAHELLAIGNLAEAREKLTSIVNRFPSSPSAPVARRIVGEMNMDEVLSTAHMEGKQIHVVKSGNSFLGLAGQYRTNLDSILHLNNLMELKNIQPGEELIVMSLDFRLLIEPQRSAISIWDGGRFIREYPILRMGGQGTIPPGKTKISSKIAELEGKQVAPQSRGYRAAEKMIQIAKPQITINAQPEDTKEVTHGIVVSPEDLEEINLITRVGNEVEFR